MASHSSKNLLSTSYIPKKAILIWDGECDFCKYWITKWQMIVKKENIDLLPYQEAADDFSDLDKKIFRKAVRLITPDGKIYSGAAAAFKSLELGGATDLPMSWYKQNPTFSQLTEWLYQKVANNRPFLYDVSHFFLGENPKKIRPSIWIWASVGALIGGSLVLQLNKKR